MIDVSKLQLVILCGGKGLRLGELTKNLPKPMLKFGKDTFLDILIKYYLSAGIKNIILLAGYKSEVIKKYYSSLEIKKKFKNIKINILEEKKLLGTAGAIKFAQKYIKSNPFLVVNGDTFCKYNINSFMKMHLKKNALITILLTKVQKKSFDSGFVKIDKRGCVINFNEKNKLSNAYNNAGIYLFDKKIFNYIVKNKKCSLEYNIFPKIKSVYGYVNKNLFIDIGTPQRYKLAKKIFKRKFL